MTVYTIKICMICDRTNEHEIPKTDFATAGTYEKDICKICKKELKEVGIVDLRIKDKVHLMKYYKTGYVEIMLQICMNGHFMQWMFDVPRNYIRKI